MTAEDEEVLRQLVGDAAVVREVFEAMPVMMAALEGPDHTMVAVNAAYRAMSGRTGFVGKPARQMYPDVAGQQLFELLDRVLASGEPVTAREWRIQIDMGGDSPAGELYLDFTLTPWRPGAGSQRGLLITQADVTERVRERQAAQRKAAEAERRYLAARDVIAELQRALLPTALPVLPDTRIAARYLVAGQDQAAGGDWFDVILLPGAGVALVVGDVVGHGVAASAAMGQLRAVLKHVLATEPDLGAALGQVDGFAASEPALHAATLCVTVLDPATGQLRYATYGHPAPLVIAPDGTARYLPATGSGPLATGADPVLGSGALRPGELVLLYSDGLIERPGRTLEEGMAELAVVAGDAAADRVLPVGAAAAAPERVCQLTVELLTRTGYADDVTTLAAQLLPVPVRAVEHELPAELASLAAFRRVLDEWLDQIGPDEGERQKIHLAVTEAITNAAEHAYPPGRPGPARLEACLGADGCLEVRVSDRGRWREPDLATSGRGLGLMLAGQLAGSIQVSHPPRDAGPRDAGAPCGTPGTVITLRHRLHRPAMLASEASAFPAARPEWPPFAAELVAAASAPHLRVAGPVDVTTADRFASRMLAASRAGALSLTVDLTAVTVLASAGVRALHQVRDQLAGHGRDLTLVAEAGTPAAAVLDLVGLPWARSAGSPGGECETP